MGYDGPEEVADLAQYADFFKECLLAAGGISLEKVNGSHDIHAPRLNANRSDSSILHPSDSVLE